MILAWRNLLLISLNQIVVSHCQMQRSWDYTPWSHISFESCYWIEVSRARAPQIDTRMKALTWRKSAFSFQIVTCIKLMFKLVCQWQKNQSWKRTWTDNVRSAAHSSSPLSACTIRRKDPVNTYVLGTDLADSNIATSPARYTEHVTRDKHRSPHLHVAVDTSPNQCHVVKRARRCKS